MEARPYFSGKRKLHEYKSEASVLPNGMRTSLSGHAKGGEVYISVFCRRFKQHRNLTKMMDRELVYSDVESGPQNHWAIHADKSYQELQHVIRTPMPKRNSRT